MIRLEDEAATLAIGRNFSNIAHVGDVIALFGDLGAGKTTFARGLLAGLGLEGEAPSPTFAIVQPYAPPETRLPVAHIDLYRIESIEEIEELGLQEIRPDTLLIIEWPERMGAALWSDALRLSLERTPDGARVLTAQVPPAWESRWPPT